jgi:acetyltransferase-like isoleucine patch superfamily enzyme
MSETSFKSLIKRLHWDMLDPHERKYLMYSFIFEIPGLFGNQLRGAFLKNRVKKCGTNLTVMAGTRFRSLENLIIGDNVSIGYDNFIQAIGGVTIGNDSFTAPGVKIWSINHNIASRNIPIRKQGSTTAEVVIGNDVFIASNAFILPGVTLPDGIVIVAGSVVNAKKYKPYSIIAGNPARMIGYRGDNMNKYY